MGELPFARKSLGQHWLTDMDSLEAMAAAAGVAAGDTVLEVGPGTGTLTEVLLAHGAAVVAVERDEKLAANLAQAFSQDNFAVQPGDILQFDFGVLPPGYKLVANIPYYLTSNLIRVLSEAANPPTVAVLLVQKEVAERAAARPGAMSLLAVTAQFYWGVSLGREVPARLFTPPPKVDSQILVLKRREQPLFGGIDTTVFFRLIKAGFSQKRKTLANSLSGGLRLPRESAISLLEQSGISPQARAQTLSLEEWHQLYQSFIAVKS